MKRNLEYAITGWLQTLSDVFKSHRRKPPKTAQYRVPENTMPFFSGFRSGHLKTSMTEYNFFFLNQGFHD